MRTSLLFHALAVASSIAGSHAAPSPGCSSGGAFVPDSVVNVTVGDDRYYLLYVPVNYDPEEPAPLVLSFHGGSRIAEQQLNLDNLTSKAFNKDYIVAYPNGVDKTWFGVPGVTTDDIGFTTTVIDEISAAYCVDTVRIFATGKSQGGGFVGQLACNMTASQRIAAFAPVSAAFYVSAPVFGNTCKPARVPIKPCAPGRADIPILDFHGGADGTISYGGGPRKGGCLPTIPHWAQTWAGYDGLGAANASRPLTDEGAVLYEWGSAEGKRGLVSHVFSGPDIDHSWPSTFNNPDNILHKDGPASFNATTMILEFFEKYPLPERSLGPE
ncbi:carbohydrate esterase family 1 protein [Pleurotus ostreatus PC15]|uniref:feruloyl esterase n=1 Tax=Pleurotus ostreatus (strain PC15) TaxID=1137138 RepID=A0A067NM92_PLEO1|nr:carbohydrate esterase family 1 protein [Pleurotus ostreatus PC15]